MFYTFPLDWGLLKDYYKTNKKMSQKKNNLYIEKYEKVCDTQLCYRRFIYKISKLRSCTTGRNMELTNGLLSDAQRK